MNANSVIEQYAEDKSKKCLLELLEAVEVRHLETVVSEKNPDKSYHSAGVDVKLSSEVEEPIKGSLALNLYQQIIINTLMLVNREIKKTVYEENMVQLCKRTAYMVCK